MFYLRLKESVRLVFFEVIRYWFWFIFYVKYRLI